MTPSRAAYDDTHAKSDMFAAYKRTATRHGGFTVTLGAYDGLATGPYVDAQAQLLVPLAGRVRVAFAGQAHVIGPERAVFLPAGLPHEATSLGGVFTFIALNAPAGWPGPVPARAIAHAGVWHQARQLALALEAPSPSLAIASLGHPWPSEAPGPDPARFLAAAIEQLACYVLAPGEAARGPGLVERAVDRILAGYAGPLPIAALAADLATSPRHLERLFAQELGQSPHQFLVAVRLAAARDLLVQPELGLEAIAARVGYADAAALARAFKAATGLPPSAYRQVRRR